MTMNGIMKIAPGAESDDAIEDTPPPTKDISAAAAGDGDKIEMDFPRKELESDKTTNSMTTNNKGTGVLANLNLINPFVHTLDPGNVLDFVQVSFCGS